MSSNKTYVLITLFLLICVIPSLSQKRGCTDPLATNYNSAAIINSGTCVYSPATYTPRVKVDSISNTLHESSGLQMAGNYLWTFNDGGGSAAIYRIDTISNAVLQTVNVEGATNIDWEDMAFDGTFFYIGDFGNNTSGARTNLKIYKFRFSEIPSHPLNNVVTIPKSKIVIINFRYKNQKRLVPGGINNTRYDCEAMIVENNKIHLFSKNWIDLNTTHYVINSTKAGSYIADSLEMLPTNYLVTGADKVRGQNLIVFIGYSPALPGRHFIHLISDFSGGKFFNGNKRRLDLPDATQMGQAEGITFRNDKYGYISNERVSFGAMVISPQKLRSFNITGYISPSSKTAQ